MREVQLLVDTLYEYQAKHDKEVREELERMRQEEEKDEENQANGEGGLAPSSVDQPGRSNNNVPAPNGQAPADG